MAHWAETRRPLIEIYSCKKPIIKRNRLCIYSCCFFACLQTAAAKNTYIGGYADFAWFRVVKAD